MECQKIICHLSNVETNKYTKKINTLNTDKCLASTQHCPVYIIIHLEHFRIFLSEFTK